MYPVPVPHFHLSYFTYKLALHPFMPYSKLPLYSRSSSYTIIAFESGSFVFPAASREAIKRTTETVSLLSVPIPLPNKSQSIPELNYRENPTWAPAMLLESWTQITLPSNVKSSPSPKACWSLSKRSIQECFPLNGKLILLSEIAE